MNLLRQFWDDDDGVTLSLEMVLWGTIVGIGLVVGLTALRSAIVSELNDMANAINAIDQSYSAGGSQFVDLREKPYTVSDVEHSQESGN